MTVAILKNGLCETTITTGTGAFSLGGAQAPFKALRDRLPTGTWLAYKTELQIFDNDGNITDVESEEGIGKITHGTPDTLSRDHVLSSTNSDALVDFSAGTKVVFVAALAEVAGWNLAGFESKTSAKTLNITHNGLTLLLDTTSGSITQALPAQADVFAGWHINIVKTAAGNNLEIDAAGAETIAPPALGGYYIFKVNIVYKFVATGSGWLVTAGHEAAGVIKDYAADSIASELGAHSCDGSNVSRTTDARLFAILSTTWGAGDGSTTFTLPDLRRRVTVGKGGSGTAQLGNAVGNTGGAETITLTTSHLPASGLSVSITSGNQSASHTHSFQHDHDAGSLTVSGENFLGADSGADFNAMVFASLGVSGTTGTAQNITTGANTGNQSVSHTHSVSGTTGNMGSGSAHNNLPPSAVVTKMIVR